jgi:coronin-7
MSEPVCTRTIDNAPGQLFPMFDESSSVCFVAGKGDTLIRYYECSFLNEYEEPWAGSCERGSDFQSNSREPIAGICLMDKRACNVMNVEVAKLLKMTMDSVVPITFTVPRAEALKSYFQDDVYGLLRSRTAGAMIDDWNSGDNAKLAPQLESLKPPTVLNISEKPVEKVATPSSVRKREVIQKEEEDKKIRNETFAKVMSKAGGSKSFKVDAKLVDDDDSDNNWDDY